ncbi:MAG: hypothetical protein U9N61_10915 [Euryarchaeota archaeon]|nr:hypothetical protein [Euryarchaeota archaeon]
MKMKLQLQPNEWSCLPTAFAMVLNKPVAKVIEDIGHDGSKIIFPEEPEPFCRRSFHIQELTDICMLRNIAVIPIECSPVSEACGHKYNIPVHSKRLDYYLVNYNGVLTGIGSSGKPHAVAWGSGKVFDPNGTTYSIENFSIHMYFLIVRFNITK